MELLYCLLVFLLFSSLGTKVFFGRIHVCEVVPILLPFVDFDF